MNKQPISTRSTSQPILKRPWLFSFCIFKCIFLDGNKQSLTNMSFNIQEIWYPSFSRSFVAIEIKKTLVSRLTWIYFRMTVDVALLYAGAINHLATKLLFVKLLMMCRCCSAAVIKVCCLWSPYVERKTWIDEALQTEVLNIFIFKVLSSDFWSVFSTNVSLNMFNITILYTLVMKW